jgi:hypothetical protein
MCRLKLAYDELELETSRSAAITADLTAPLSMLSLATAIHARGLWQSAFEATKEVLKRRFEANRALSLGLAAPAY